MADVNASPSMEAGSEETGQRARVADAIRETVTVETIWIRLLLNA